MFGQLRDVAQVIVGRIVFVDGDDFVIFFVLINHLHHTDGARRQKRHWQNGFLPQDQNVERIVVIAVGAWDESVVGGVKTAEYSTRSRRSKPDCLSSSYLRRPPREISITQSRVSGVDVRGSISCQGFIEARLPSLPDSRALGSEKTWSVAALSKQI